MPIYAYKCAACGHASDALQKISDAPLTVCPSCGQPELKKQLTAPGFQLKGSGWYATDFRNSGAGPKSGESKQAGGAETAAPATETAAAAKPATPAAEKPSTPAPAAAPAGESR
jgi:putative FmdB family regulatory protein